jgi:hypothetical protein
MMVFSLQIPLKLPDVCLMENSPFSKADFISDEEQVQAIVNHLNETMTDPFDIEDHPPCLMNISTGMHATREVQD